MSFPLPLSMNDADAAKRSVSYFAEGKFFYALPSSVNYEPSDTGLFEDLLSNYSRRHCQLSRPWYARCVGGAAARVGRRFSSLLCCPALTEQGRKKAPGSVKLTM